MKRKILSMVLTLCLLLSMFPALVPGASAEEPEDEYIVEEPAELEPEEEIDAIADEPVVEPLDGDGTTVLASGYCGGEGDGTNLTWTLYDDGTLTISGTGAMADYSDTYYGSKSTAPWFEYETNLTALIIEGGVISIGDYAFYKCTGFAGDLVIPDSVTSIGDYAFCYCDGFTGSLVIPCKVTTIGSNAFVNTDLTEVIISDSVTTIGPGAFSSCHDLERIIIPSSVTSATWALTNCEKLLSAGPVGGDFNIQFDWTSIPDRAFSKTSITQIVFPDGITYIGDGAFANCVGLTELVIPDSVTTIRYDAFEGCTGLTDVTIPSSVTSIWAGVFDGCEQLTSAGPIGGDYSIQYGWTDSIPAYAFYGSEILSIVFPDEPTSIGFGAFHDCANLIEVDIPKSVASIDSCAFSGCKGLGEVILPDGVSIGDGVFEKCTSLTSINLPENATIGQGVFQGCSCLAEITIPGSVTSIGFKPFSECEQLTSAGPIGGDYSIQFEWSDSIPDNAFSGAPLVDIVFPEGITSIGASAFSGSDFEELTIPNSVTSIGAAAFSDCTKLIEITMPEGIVSISTNTFSNCSNLKNITIPNTVTSIGARAFRGCSSLKKLVIPDSVTSIDYCAFEGCSELSEIIIPASVTSINPAGNGSLLFNDCEKLSSAGPIGGNYNIQFGWTDSIPARAFEGSEIISIVFPDSIKSIGARAFCFCTKLTNPSLPEGLVYIEDYAFSQDYSLSEITIPSYVTSIGSFAFYECSGLTQITIYNSVTTIKAYAFCGCSSLTDVYYYGTEEEWANISVGSANDPLKNANIHFLSTCEHSNLQHVEAVDAKCEVAGNIEYWYCVDCDGYFTDVEAKNSISYENTIIPDLEHEFVDGVCIYCKKLECEPVENSFAVQIYADGKYFAVDIPVNFRAIVDDSVDVVSYYWSFGDGTSSSDKNTIHSFNTSGEHRIVLTVTDANGNTGEAQVAIDVIDVEKNPQYTVVSFTVCDATNLVPIADANLTLVSEAYEITCLTDDSGAICTVVPNDVYVATCCAEGYLVRSVNITADGGTDTYTLGLTTGSIMTGELNVTSMTRDEIIEAGIDPDAEGNAQVYKFEATLTFVAGTKTYKIPYVIHKNSNGNIVGNHKSYSIDLDIGETVDGCIRIKIFPISEKFLLVVYGEARWLKEMYHVELVVINHSLTDTLEDVRAELVLPDGISLAEMSPTNINRGTQTLAIDVGSLGYGETVSANWYVRGDKEGEYDLSVELSATSMPFGEKLSQTYTTDSPLRVYAGSALHMTVKADDIAERGKEYTVAFKLENVSDKSIYNLTFGITGSEQYKVIGFGTGEAILPITSTEYGDSFTQTIEELAPGGYIELELKTTIWFNSALELVDITKLGAFVDISYYLTDISVVALEGSTTNIPYSIELNETEKSFLIDKVIKNIFKEKYGDDLPTGTLGSTLIEMIGDDFEFDSLLIKAAKTVLKFQQGETDHYMYIKLDDGLGTDDSIYNDFVMITTGSGTDAVVDILNGTKLTIDGGEVSIQAKAPGSTKLKIGVENKYGEVEREYTVNVTIADTVIKNKITLAQDAVSGAFSYDENKLEAAIKKQVSDERDLLSQNPFLWFDSTMVFDVSQTTSNSEYSASVSNEFLKDLLEYTATEYLAFESKVLDLTFNRNSIQEIENQIQADCTLVVRRLPDAEAAELGSDTPTYQIALQYGDGKITKLGGGTAYVSLPYALAAGEEANDIYVEHIKDDGTIETIKAIYDENTGTINFSTDSFSYFRIVTESSSLTGKNIASGYCGGEGDGTNLTWVLTNDGTLTISGEGAMADYDSHNNKNPAPWIEYSSSMRTLVLEDGITTIGSCAFFGCSDFSGDLVIPDSVTSIKSYAFDGCSGFTGHLIIPGRVTLIGASAFDGCRGFNGNLYIPYGVTTIEGGAFWYCSCLTGDLVIPDSVTSIGPVAFGYCSGFTGDLVISNNVTSIEMMAFGGCSGFTGNLVIPNSVTSIGSSAFFGCEGFNGNLVIPNSVTSIGSQAFADCKGFNGNLVIPNSVTSIGDNAFSGCEGFNGTLVIPDSVTSIGRYAFSGCSGFSGNLVLSSNVAEVGDAPFYGASGIIWIEVKSANPAYTSKDGILYDIDFTTVIQAPGGLSGELRIPDSVTSIGNYAFYDCRRLTGNLVIPDGVTSVGFAAFDNCVGLSGNLVVPSSIISIGGDAFTGCSSLSGDVYFEGDAPDVWSTSTWSPSFPTDFTLYYIPGTTGWTDSDAYDADAGTWNGYKLDTWDGTGESNVLASGYCGGEGDGTNLTWTLTDDGTLTISGTGAMADFGYEYDYENNEWIFTVPWTSYVDSLKTLVIESGVTTIGNNAFKDCSGFTGDLVIPDGVTTIGDSAFSNCSGFTGDLLIPDSVTYIGKNAFTRCEGFDGKLTISTSVTSIEYATFSECGFTGELVIPDGVTRIDGFAFSCLNSGFTGELVIPSSVTSIGECAFQRCSGFTGELVIPSSVTSIGDSAFHSCSGFTGTLVIPSTVTEIGSAPFAGTSGITWIEVESANPNYASKDGILYDKDFSIVIQAPGGLSGELNIPDSVTTIGKSAFYFCKNLTGDLVIPNGVTSIGDGAFNNCSGFTGSLVIPDGVTSIESLTFGYCSGFSGDLVIPSGVSSIGILAFDGCTGLSGDVYFEGNAPTVTAASEVFHSFPSDFTLYYIPGTTGWTDSEYYDADAGTWNGYKLEVWDTSEIDEYAPRLVVQPVTGRPGDTVEVKINVENNPGLVGIATMVTFDSDILEYVSCEISSEFSGVNNSHLNDNTLKTIWVTGDEAVTVNDTFLTITFKINEDAEDGDTYITLDYDYDNTLDANEECIELATFGDYVTVFSGILGDVNNSGTVTSLDVRWILQYLSGAREFGEDQLALADVNSSGTVTSLDVRWILQYLSGARDENYQAK